ncbi:MAG: hypothetical protein ABI574_11730 [Burkholderiales bacterium]
MTDTPTLESLRRDLVARLYAIAFTLNASIRGGSGDQLLGLPIGREGMYAWPDYDEFDLNPFEMERTLQDLYDYAYLGLQKRAGNVFNADEEDGDLGRILAVIRVSNAESCEYNLNCDIAEHFDRSDKPRGGLEQLVSLSEARRSLDCGEDLTLRQVGILAGGIDPKSMRSAMYKGDARIEAFKVDDEYMVHATDALRWLRKRTAFIETNWIGRAGPAPQPDSLFSDEIIPFINNRLEYFYQDAYNVLAFYIKQSATPERIASRYAQAGRNIGWSEERVLRLAKGSAIDIQQADVAEIARMIYVDRYWLAKQIARTHEEAGIAVEPQLQSNAGSESARPITRLIENGNALEVTLSAAGVEHGYIDIQSAFVHDFFPSDCIGSRTRGDEGKKVTWLFDEKMEKSDLRKKSEALYSPRRRFSAWFRKNRAAPGDLVIFRRVEDRTYELTLHSKFN